jgi:bacterioferritin-associated ferredoxin
MWAVVTMREVMPEISWMALAICVVTSKTPSQAFNTLVTDPCYSPDDERREIAEQDDDMVRLKRHLTYDRIGQLYNMKPDAVYRRIKRQKERDVVTYSYYCDHCQEVPLHLKGKDRCGKCGNEVRKVLAKKK